MSTHPVPESTLPPVLTVEHMAHLLGMSVRTLYDAMKRPTWCFTELPSLDRKKRWSRDAVLAVINRQTIARPQRRAS
jgi:predicted DNA-binding transcriptional regulator AlpA